MIKEELGLDIESKEFILVKTLKRKNVFRDCYIILKDISIDSINFNDNEVMDCKYVSIEEFKEIIEKGKSTFTDFSQTIFNYIDINELKKEFIMEERFTLRCAVHLFLIKDDNILVEKRKNRTYSNGQYDVIASHILGNEDVYTAIINTAKKEVNIDIKRQDIIPIQVMHHKSDECEYIHYFFVTDKYEGQINNNEPEICERLEWVKFKYPIDNMMEYINYAIKKYQNNPNDKFTVLGFND